MTEDEKLEFMVGRLIDLAEESDHANEGLRELLLNAQTNMDPSGDDWEEFEGLKQDVKELRPTDTNGERP